MNWLPPHKLTFSAWLTVFRRYLPAFMLQNPRQY
jgi:hypothetical protein